MMYGCCIKECKSRSTTENQNSENTGTSFFRFPKTQKIKTLWENALNYNSCTLRHTVQICSNHFEKSCFETNPKMLKSIPKHLRATALLKPDAVPSIFDEVRPEGKRYLRSTSMEDCSSKAPRQLKELQFINPGPALDSKNFVPEKSHRQEKKMQRIMEQKKKGFYDEDGKLTSNGEDVCDCLMKNCPGCFFPCSNCKGTKCGNTCRENRTWYYESMSVESKTVTTRKFPYPPTAGMQ